MKKHWLVTLLGILILWGCGGLVALQVPTKSLSDIRANWLMLGKNPAHQHSSETDVTPPLKIVWKKKVSSVVVDHPLSINDYILTITKNGILNIIDFQKGYSFGNGRIAPGIQHVPTIWRDFLIVGSNLGRENLIFYDLLTSQVILKKQYPPITTSPLVVEDKIYFGTDKGILYCVNNGNGEKIWYFRSKGTIYSSPAYDPPRIIFADVKGNLYAVDHSSGIQLWKIQLEGNIFGHPVLDKGKIFIGTAEGYFYGIDSRTGQILWRQKFSGSVYGSASVFDGVIYVGNNAHEVTALDQKSGRILWKYTTDGIVNTAPLPSPHYLYVGSWDRNLYVLNRLTGKFIFKMKFKKPMKSAPIIHGKYLIIQSANNNLYALGNEELVAELRRKR